MSNALIVVVAIVVLLIVTFVVWQRRAVARQADALEKVARGIRELRMRASRHPTMNPIPETSGAVPAEFATITGELERQGFRVLGDVEELDFDDRVVGRMRWFTSADNTVFGWFAVLQGTPLMLLLSEDAGGGFAVTVRSPHAPTVVAPETVREFRLRWEEGLDEAITGHRAGLQAMSAPVTVTDLDGALASFRRLKDHTSAWRARQEPEGLLEADVRKIVGDRFDELGPSVIAIVEMIEAIDVELNRTGRA